MHLLAARAGHLPQHRGGVQGERPCDDQDGERDEGHDREDRQEREARDHQDGSGDENRGCPAERRQGVHLALGGDAGGRSNDRTEEGGAGDVHERPAESGGLVGCKEVAMSQLGSPGGADR